MKSGLWTSRWVLAAAAIGAVLGAGTACRKGSGGGAARTLILGAYTVPKEAYEQRIIPAFQAYWKQKTGETIEFQASYVASGQQGRAIAGGSLEADVAALSLEADVDRIRESGLITHDWKTDEFGGMVTHSLVVIGTRPGNPLNIAGWQDLARDDVWVVTPDPGTSGGAMWNVNAIWGAGLLGENGSQDAARALLRGVRARVKSLDPSGREAMTTFERGVGDAVITYENELLLRRKQGRDYGMVIPAATVRIENPVALVDKYADEHGVRDVAEAFVAFLRGEEAQRAFAEYGFRPVLPSIAAETAAQYPVPANLFTVTDLGGWKLIKETLYSPDGIWAQVNREVAGQ